MADRPLYCAPAMIRAELPLDLPGNAFSDEAFEERIALWSGYIDDYLASVYDVPFEEFPATPASVQVACTLLVTYYSYIVAGLPSEKEDPRQSLWGRAHDILDKINARQLTLTDMDGDPATNPKRSTLAMMIGASQSPASMLSQDWHFGPLRGRWRSAGGDFHGGFRPDSGDGGPESP